MLDGAAGDILALTLQDMTDLPRAVELAVGIPGRTSLEAQGGIRFGPGRSEVRMAHDGTPIIAAGRGELQCPADRPSPVGLNQWRLHWLSPYISRCSSMKAVICGTGGRAPPEQNTRSPVGLTQWRLHWLTLLQNLVGLTEFTNLALQLFDPCLLSRRLARPFAAIALDLPDPNAKAIRRTAQFTRDRR